VIEAGPMFLGLEEPEAGAALRPHLEADGIMLMIGDPCVAVEQPFMGPSRSFLARVALAVRDRLCSACIRRRRHSAARSLVQNARGCRILLAALRLLKDRGGDALQELAPPRVNDIDARIKEVGTSDAPCMITSSRVNRRWLL
jgi:hypothetical protein